MYVGNVYLKQGFYNYKFALKHNGQADYNAIGGNFYQTENTYTVLVYYRDTADRYDRVIGMGSLQSTTSYKGSEKTKKWKSEETFLASLFTFSLFTFSLKCDRPWEGVCGALYTIFTTINLYFELEFAFGNKGLMHLDKEGTTH